LETPFGKGCTSTSMQNPVAREAVAKAIEIHEKTLTIYEELD
jgi:hypothetical protein